MKLRLFKKALKVLLISVIGILLLIIIFLNLPSSHRFINNRVNQIFINADLPIHIGSISAITPGSLYVHNVLLTGSENDTILFAKNLKSSFKTFALFKKRVMLPSIEIENANIFFSRNDPEKGLNIAEAFAHGEKDTLLNNTDRNKKWEVSIGKADLKEIRFRMTDSVSGIFIYQDAGHILVETDKMSLIEKKIIVRSLEIEGSTGNITLNSPKEPEKKSSSSAWDIGLTGLSLKNINLIIDDQPGKLKLDLLAGEILINTRKTDLRNKDIDIEKAEFSRTNIILLMDKIAPKLQKEEKSISDKFQWNIIGDKLNITDVSLRIAGYSDPATDNQLTGFSVLGLNMKLSDLKLSDPVVNANVKNLSFSLGNGFSLKSMSCKLDSHSGTTNLDMALETGNSKIDFSSSADADFFNLVNNPSEIKNAVINLKESTISLTDIVYFREDLKKISVYNTLAATPISLNGNILMNDSVLSLASLSISQNRNIELFFNGEIKHIFTPDMITGDLQFRFTKINNNWITELLKELKIADTFPDLNLISVEGTLSDSLRTQNFSINVNSGFGDADLLGSFDMNLDTFSVKSVFKQLRLGTILNNPMLGSFSGSADIKGKGIRHKSIVAETVLMADSVSFYDYNYTRSRIECKISPGIYDLKLMINDPSLEVSMEIAANNKDSIFSASLDGRFSASLNNLHFYKDSLAAEGRVTAGFRKRRSNIESDLTLSGLKLTTPYDIANIRQMNASFGSDSITTSISAKSDFFNADISVEKSGKDFGKITGEYLSYIKTLINPIHTDSLKHISSLPVLDGKFNITYNNFFQFFIPDTNFIFRNISGSVNTSTENNTINYGANLQGFEYNNIEIGNLSVSLTDSASIMDLLVNADACTLGSQFFNNIHLTSHFADWQSLTNLSIMGNQGNKIYDFEIGSTNDKTYIYLTIPSKQIILNGFRWQLDSPDFLKINRSDKALIPSLNMHTGDSFISLNKDEFAGKQTFDLGLGNIVLNSLYRTEILPGKPNGTINGSAKFIINSNKSSRIETDLQVTDMSWSDLNYKKIMLNGYFSSENPEVFDLNFIAMLDSSEIKIQGNKELKGNRSINAQFKLIPVNSIQPFVGKFLTDLRGYVSGDFNLSTKNNAETLAGELLMEDVNLKINSLNSSYRIPEDRILFADKKMTVSKFEVLDSLGHQLFIDGSINFRNKNSILADLDISSSNLQVMNRKNEKNSTFYGTIFVDTKLSVKGPVTSPVLKGKIILTGGTDIFFRQQDNLNLSESEKVLTFVSNKSASVGKDLGSDAGKSLYNKTSIESIVEIDPTTRLSIELSKKMFNIGLVIKGGGELNYDMLVNNQVNLSGKYEVSEGSADLKMIGWPNKAFKIMKGGFIRWDGKLEDPELQFEAVNKVTSSYVNPVDNKERYVNFDVTLKISNRLSSMDVAFTLNTSDQYLMSIINTLSPEEQMRQAITILLFENVDLPGISTTSNYVSEQVNQLVASQLNALTKTTIKGIDISFGIDSYVQANASGGQETKTSLSYEVKRKLMNDRAQIELSGRINDGSSKQTSTEMSLNNVTFEYRLDSAATKFLKVYNEHTYEDVFEGEVIKTGVGITYRKNYPRLGDIWRKDGEKKRRKDEEKKRQSEEKSVKQNSQDR
jgi:translocation and assembly module TamB